MKLKNEERVIDSDDDDERIIIGHTLSGGKQREKQQYFLDPEAPQVGCRCFFFFFFFQGIDVAMSFRDLKGDYE